MKFYIIPYVTAEGGELKAFTSKREAQNRYAELKKQEGVVEEREFGPDYSDVETVHQIWEAEFPATKEGLRQAIEYGASTVPK